MSRKRTGRTASLKPGAGMDRLDTLCDKRNLRWGISHGEKPTDPLAVVVWAGIGPPTLENTHAFEIVGGVAASIDAAAASVVVAFP